MNRNPLRVVKWIMGFMKKHLLLGALLALFAVWLAACSGDSALSVYLEANRDKLRQPLGALALDGIIAAGI